MTEAKNIEIATQHYSNREIIPEDYTELSYIMKPDLFYV